MQLLEREVMLLLVSPGASQGVHGSGSGVHHVNVEGLCNGCFDCLDLPINKSVGLGIPW